MHLLHGIQSFKFVSDILLLQLLCEIVVDKAALQSWPADTRNDLCSQVQEFESSHHWHRAEIKLHRIIILAPVPYRKRGDYLLGYSFLDNAHLP